MDIGGWLRSFGLEQYEAVFRENEIDGSVLPDLSEDHLRELGFPLGARLKIMKAIGALHADKASTQSRDAILQPPQKAQAYFEHALAIARQQQAKSWGTPRRHEPCPPLACQARELLAPVYGWFKEGFDTRDLKEAKARCWWSGGHEHIAVCVR